jgi:hypothetical protein
LYKVNLPDNPGAAQGGITHCVINTDFDYLDNGDQYYIVPVAERYRPIYASPTVIVDNESGPSGEIDYNLRVFFGTGAHPRDEIGPDGLTPDAAQYYFFSYVDRDEKGACNTGLSGVELDWFFKLPKGHRIFASAFAAAGRIYFGTAASEIEDPCQSPKAADEGAVFVLDQKDGALIKRVDTGGISAPPLVMDEHLYVSSTSKGLQSFGGEQYNNDVRPVRIGPVTIGSWNQLD